MMIIKESLYSDGYVIQEEGMLLDRVGNTNFFKENPYDPWAHSLLNVSLVELDPNDIEYNETPSESKLEKMGNYKEPDYNEYSTGFPIAISYKGRIILLDGHHRVELAKRAKKRILVAVKNVDDKYGSKNIVKESLNEIKQNIETSGLGAIKIGTGRMIKAYEIIKREWPKRIKTAVPVLEKFKKTAFRPELNHIERKLKISLEDYLWIDQDYNNLDSFSWWIKDNIKWDKKMIISGKAWDYNDVQSAKYNNEYDFGVLSFSRGMLDKNRINGYFVKYK